MNNSSFEYDKPSLEYYLESMKVFKDVLSKESRPGFIPLFADFNSAYENLKSYVNNL